MTAIGDTLPSSDEASNVRKWVRATRHKLPTLPLNPMGMVWIDLTPATRITAT